LGVFSIWLKPHPNPLLIGEGTVAGEILLLIGGDLEEVLRTVRFK